MSSDVEHFLCTCWSSVSLWENVCFCFFAFELYAFLNVHLGVLAAYVTCDLKISSLICTLCFHFCIVSFAGQRLFSLM